MAFSTDLVKVVVKSGESDWVYLKQGETVVVLGTCVHIHDAKRVYTQSRKITAMYPGR